MLKNHNLRYADVFAKAIRPAKYLKFVDFKHVMFFANYTFFDDHLLSRKFYQDGNNSNWSNKEEGSGKKFNQ